MPHAIRPKSIVTDDLLDLIGGTPMLEITNHFQIKNDSRVFAKLECMNPTGSIKDRTALGLIAAAERTERLRPGGTVVAATSGNFGISLSMICARRAYKCICVVDPKAPPSSISRIKSLGGIISEICTPDEHGSFQILRIKHAQELCDSINGSVLIDQYDDTANVEAHYCTTGVEIYHALSGQIDVLVGSVSTGGHLCGTAKFLKERIPGLTVIGVEPDGSVVFGGESHPFLQNGAGLSFVSKNFLGNLIDKGIKVSDEIAFLNARRFARREGLLIGGSSGAALHGCRCTIESNKPSRIVVILADEGDRYLDTIYSDQWMNAQGFLAREIGVEEK